jgi:hypothetical protein
MLHIRKRGSLAKVTHVPNRCIVSNEWHRLLFPFFPAPSGAPKSVAFIKRSKSKLTVSWRAPAQKLRNGQLTGYNVCYSDKSRSSNPICSPTNAHSNTAQINNLRFATKYFVTVAARKTAGYGLKSMEISKITNGGKRRSYIMLVEANMLQQPQDNWKLFLPKYSMNSILYSCTNTIYIVMI